MALDFPANPVNGQVYDNFYYDSFMGTWRAQGSGLALNAFINPTISGGTISGLTTDLAVSDGGTGVSSFLDNVYLKGNGVLPITGQSGIPASDISSGQLSAARMPAGTVVQVVQKVDTAQTAISTGAEQFFNYGGLNLTVTPKLSGSKFLISYMIRAGSYQYSRRFILVVNESYQNTSLGGSWAASTGSLYHDGGVANGASIYEFNGEYLYQNTGTNNVVIRFDGHKQDPNPIYINRAYTYDDTSRGRPTSTLTVMEIAQ